MGRSRMSQFRGSAQSHVKVRKWTDEDYVAWRELKEIHELIVKDEEKVAELFSRIEIAKKQCIAGIRRARSIRNKRRAKTNGFLVPMPHYKIYVYGASPAGLTPHSWMFGSRRRTEPWS